MEEPEKTDNNQEDDSDLEKLALEEIIKESRRGKERAETMGPMGWIKCPLARTNKRFLKNVLVGTLENNKRSKLKHEKIASSRSSHNSTRKNKRGDKSRPINKTKNLKDNCTHVSDETRSKTEYSRRKRRFSKQYDDKMKC